MPDPKPYHVTYRLDDRTITFQEPLADPFVHATIHIGFRDLLRAVIRRSLRVSVIVGADRETIRQVMNLGREETGS